MTTLETMHIEKVRAAIDRVESEIGSRYYGLENVTQNGPRLWSIAPAAPKAAIAAIKGTGAAPPRHIVKRYCTIRRAWRSIDLSTTKRVWYTDAKGIKREIQFI